MSRSQLTSLRARTVIAGHSQLVRLRAQTLGTTTGHSQLTGFRARTTSSARSQLTGFRAANLSSSGPTAVITGPTEPVDIGDEFVLSLANSFGGTFTGYVWSQVSGPTAVMVPDGDEVTITAPAARPSTVGYPNDAPLQMVFQGVVETLGGAVSDGDSFTVELYAHLTWAANNTALYWHLPT